MQKLQSIEESQYILCSGILRSKNGSVRAIKLMFVCTYLCMCFTCITMNNNTPKTIFFKQKLQAFLFDRAFVLTQISTRNAPLTSYQVYRNVRTCMCVYVRSFSIDLSNCIYLQYTYITYVCTYAMMFKLSYVCTLYFNCSLFQLSIFLLNQFDAREKPKPDSESTCFLRQNDIKFDRAL